jgi:hypothetical protein
MMKLNEDFDEEWDEHKRRLLQFIVEYAENPLTKNHVIYNALNTGTFNNLIEYFEELEEYENCSLLLNVSKALRRNQYTEGEFFLFK